MGILSSLSPQDTEGSVFQLTVFHLVTGEPQCVQHKCGMIGHVLDTDKYTEVEASSHTALNGPSYIGRTGWLVWGLRALTNQDSR